MASTDLPLAPREDLAPLPFHQKSWRDSWIALTIGLLILLVAFSSLFSRGGGPMDEGTLLVYPEMVQRGAIPYRDFETFYGPANPYLLAGAYTIFGTNIGVERAVGLLYRVVILVAIFAITRRWGTAIAAACMLLSGLLLLPLFVTAFAWFGALACALGFLWAMTMPNAKWRCLLGGFLAGLALLFRADLGVAVILAAFVLVRPLAWAQQWRFLSGVALALVPLALLVGLAGPEQVFNNLFLYPVIRSGPARRISLSAAEPVAVRLFFLILLAAAANILAGLVAVRRNPSEWRSRVLLGLALLGAGVLPQAWQRLDLGHVVFVAFLILGIFTLALSSFFSPKMAEHRHPWAALGAGLVVAGIVSIVAPIFPEHALRAFSEAVQTTPSGGMFVERGDRSFPVGPPERVVSIGRMLDKLEQLSKPGDRLFVGPADLSGAVYSDTFLYHLLPRLRPATYFLEMNPGSANRPGSRLASDVASADWLILNSEWVSTQEKNASREPEIIVRDHFRPVGSYGSFTLFRRAP